MNRVLLSLLLIGALWSCGKEVPAASDHSITVDPPRELSVPVREVPTAEGRFAWQKPQVVIDRMGDLTDKVVADIGAGTGYFTFRIAPKASKVIAVDIDQDMLQLINVFRQNLDSLQREKVETRLATAESPQLDKEEVDLAIIINTIGYISDKKQYLKNLAQSLTPSGELLLVDFKMKRIPADIAPDPSYRINLIDLENLLVESGYDHIQVDDRTLDYQWIVKASKKD